MEIIKVVLMSTLVDTSLHVSHFKTTKQYDFCQPFNTCTLS